MGAYLSEPIKEKLMETAENDFVSYSSGSMQGWRTSQEDAHNCILEYTKNMSLFAVYDGHGGAEVAQLCANKLPDFIKASKEFNDAKFSEALTKSFLDFDSSILTKDNQEELKSLIKTEETENERSDSDVEDDDPSLLAEEAEKPLEQILGEYDKSMIEVLRRVKKDGKYGSAGDSAESADGRSDLAECLTNPEMKKVFDYALKLKIPDESEEDEDDDSDDYTGEDDGEEEDESESDEEEDDEEEDDEEDDNEESSLFQMNGDNAPGFDSGSTAVLSLIDRENMRLYVANAGDSRCVLCRTGAAVDMSVDHKPEDEEETARIKKAGGKLSMDGRVNGGLNLSRAIGDHSYKRNKDLALRDQMISALPDVKTIDLNLDEDEFMVLACDGIWNTYSSQELIDFIKKRLPQMETEQIISEIFNSCLAPNTNGDGTGCDNMTCVIVRFKEQQKQNGSSTCNGEVTATSLVKPKKRPLADSNEADQVEEEQASAAKIRKTN